MSRLDEEAVDDHGVVSGIRTISAVNGVGAMPQTATRLCASMPSDSDVFRFVAATPDVNVSDKHPLQTSLTTGSRTGDGGPPQEGVSERQLLSLTHHRHGASSTNTSAPVEDLPLPILTTLPFSGVSGAVISFNTTDVGVNMGAGEPIAAAAGVVPEAAFVSPGTSPAGRSMTLLERRNNRERTTLSFSCLSGLSVERLQESMRDTNLVPNSDEIPHPKAQGWSKTVASAALLRDYTMPSLHPSLTDVSRELCAEPPNDGVHRQASQLTGSREDGGGDGKYLHRPFTSPSELKAMDAIPGAVKVIGYNILASRLASTDLYPSCPPSVLSEDYRVGLIKEELRCVDPDILLLEEISVGVHELTLGPYLRSTLGMEGHHVVITDRDGNPRCAPLTPPSESASLVSPIRAMPSRISSETGKRRHSSIASSTPPPASVSMDVSARRATADDFPKNIGCIGKRKCSSHLPQLHEPSLSRSSCRRDRSIESSRSPAYACNAPRVWERREEASQQLQNPKQPTTPPHGTSPSLRGGVMVNSERVPIEGDVVHRGDRQDFSSGTTAQERRLSTLGKLPSTVSPVTGGSRIPCGTVRSEKAVEDAVGHRRLEMDGVSVFYKAARFRALEVKPVLFNRLAAAEKRLTRDEQKKLQVNSHNVALVVVLQDMQVTGVSRIYVVAAVHLIWQRIKSQLWQAHQLLSVMEALKHKYSKGFVDRVYPSGYGYLEDNSEVTQPPSITDTPLWREGAPNHLQDHMTHVLTQSSPLPLLRSCTPPARRPGVVPSHAATDASDSAGDGSGGHLPNVVGPDRTRGQCTRGVSGGCSLSAAAVTCVIGGDFNSERSGPVMEYLRTGRISGEADVMAYWRLLESKSPVQLDRTEEQRKGLAADTCATNVSAPTPPPPAVPPKVVGVTSSPEEDLSGSSLHSSARAAFYSIDSPPHQRQRRPTQFQHTDVGDTVDHAANIDATEGDGLCLLHPYTPLRRRPSNLYSGRVADDVLLAPDMASNPRQARCDNSTAPTTVVPTSPVMTGGTTSPQTFGQTLHVGCRSTSPDSSLATSLLPDIASQSAGGNSSVSTAAATLPQTIPAAFSNLDHRGGAFSGLLLSPSRISMSKTTAGVAFASVPTPRASSLLEHQDRGRVLSPPHQLSSSQRRISLEVVKTEESTSRHSGSPSISEVESLLSTGVGTNCAMRLVLHTRRDSPANEFGGRRRENGDSQGRTAPSGQAAHGASLLEPSPNQGYMIGKGGIGGVADKSEMAPILDGCVKVHTRPANVDAGRGGSCGLNLGALRSESSLHAYMDLATPASPRSHQKRRLASAASRTVVPISTVPQSRCVASSALQHTLPELQYDATSSMLSTPLQGGSFSCLPELCSKNAYTTPRSPLLLIDEVAHSIRLSDAYAPYCYRHPSCVSAMNPSTNMEGKVLDHILYEDEHVVCGGVLRLGERQELPNARVPSDHYMVGSVLIPIDQLRQA